MFFTTDSHEDLSPINAFINDKENINIIHLGDIMIYYDSYNMRHLNDRFKTKNIMMYVVKGNHDASFYFDGQHDLEMVKFLPDYTVKNIEGQNILFVGGGISIDRKQRNDEYNPFVLNIKKIKKLPKIDIIASHISPWYCQPIQYNNIVNYFRKFDLYLDRDIKKERQDMAKLVEEVNKKGKIKLFINGHYHNDYLTLVDGIEYRCVAMEKFFEL